MSKQVETASCKSCSGLTLRDCAVKDLSARRDSLGRLLKKKQATSIRNIHRLRIELRRSSLSLAFFAPVLDEKRSARLQKFQRDLRKSIGPLREIDVLLQACFRWHPILDSEELAMLILAISGRRIRMEKKIRARLKKYRDSKSLEKALDIKRLLRKTRGISVAEASDWVRSHLKAETGKLRRLRKSDLSGIHPLHKWRVDCRSLRYTLEIVEKFDFVPIEDLVKDFHRVQVELGEIHDSLEITKILNHSTFRASGLSPKSTTALIDLERTRAHRAREDFWTWWRQHNPAARLDKKLEQLSPG